MRFQDQTFNRGVDEALADFGLVKVAIMSAAQRQQALEAYRARPKGMAAVQAAGGSPAPVANVPQASTAGGWSPSGPGGPGAAPGFGGGARALPLETDPMTAAHNRAMVGIPAGPQQVGAAAIPGAAARAQLAAQKTPLIPGRTVLGHLLLASPS